MTERDGIAVVSGGRRYTFGPADVAMLDMLLEYHAIGEVWHGGAIGVDECASIRAVELGLGTRVFLPEPTLFLADMKRKLLERNKHMIADLDAAVHHEGRRGIVIAFVGEDGTNNLVEHAHRARLHVIDLRAHPHAGWRTT